jgi:hypothetical protein
MITTRKGSMKRLNDQQVIELLGLLKKVDSAELKLTVPESDHRSAIQALDLDPLDAQIRQVFFFDTMDLALNKAGVVVRARRIQGRAGDSTIKLRPIDPDELSPEIRKSPGFGVEVDALPGGFVCSGTMKGVTQSQEVRDTAAGNRAIRKLFTREQKDFYASHAPEGLGLDDLAVLGPLNVLKLKFTPPDSAQSFVAEMWFYPDGSRILELSTKCLPNEAFQVATEARGYLASKGIDLSAQQQTKTAAALRYFTKQVTAAAAG